MKKRILSMLLALVMLATLLPVGLIDTAEAAATHSGTCGENVTWTLTNDGTLTISGIGEMADYYIFSVPWYDTRSQVKTVIIKNGVTSIGNCAFADCSSLTSATIPDSVTSIGNWAFYGCSSLTDVYYGGTETDWAKITIKDGNEPLLNATLHTGVVFAPANVTLGSAKAVNSGIQVTWQKAEDAAKYRVYRKDAANTNWKTIATVSGTSYTDKTAKIGTRYTYTVRGIAFDGKTLSPGYDKTGVSATATPARVALVGAKRVATGTKGIQVTWKPAANAQTYNVYRAVNPPSGDVPASAWALVGEKVNALSFTDTTGKSGTAYTYTVRGVNANGKLSPGYNKTGVSAVAK